MPDITTSDLARFARQSDIELRVTVNQDGQQQIQERHGWLGGRLARGLKIAFGREDRAQKQQQYVSAKSEVLKALKRTYGDEIGERAFRAGIGEMRDGQHRTSSDHPITGRHIQKMIEVAEREIAQLPGLQDFGENGFRDQSGHAMTEQATAGWMSRMAQRQDSLSLEGDLEWLQQIDRSPSGRLMVDELHYGLRSEPVLGARARMAPGLTMTSSIARDLIGDIDRKFGDEPQQAHGFWTIDLEMSWGGRALGGSRQHVIGIFVDRNDPNTIRVFDANRREVAVPRDQFAGWLAAHIKDVYGDIGAISLYRAEEKRIGTFERTGDRWTCDTRCVLGEMDQFRAQTDFYLQQAVESGEREGLYNSFWGDCHRSTTLISNIDGEIPSQITRTNANEAMLGLVNQDAFAAKGLSCLIGQSIHNAVSSTVGQGLTIGDQLIVPRGTERSSVKNTIVLNGDMLEITYTTTKPIEEFTMQDPITGLYDAYKTSVWTDYVRSSVTIRVSIQQLREAGQNGTIPEFEVIEPPNSQLHIENYQGVQGFQNLKTVDVALGEDGVPGRWTEFERAMRGRVTRQELMKVGNLELPLTECLLESARSMTLKIGDGEPEKVPRPLRTQIPERFLPLVDGHPNRAAQLSRLIDVTIVDDFCDELGYAVGATGEDFNHYYEGPPEFAMQTVMIGDEPMVEVTMSRRLNTQGFSDPPNDLVNSNVYGSMTIRVPFSELDNGHPENFIVVHQPHFEIR